MAISNDETFSLANELAQSLKTSQLEQIYERAVRQSEFIYETEKARALRVQLLLLEDENFTMQDQLADAEEQVDRIRDDYEETVEHLGGAEGQINTLQNELKIKLRELETYKAEVRALNTVSADSTKLLTEKLALSRQLAALQPEIEHLRSQAATNQTALSEKLALQREVSSLQVELENEKRAVQRVKTKDSKVAEDDGKAQAQIEELKKELARERKEQQKTDRDHRKQLADWEGQKTILESKLDAFRNKLRITKEQLKDTQEELEKARSDSARATLVSTSNDMRRPAHPRKRSVARFDPDMTIGTPGESYAAKRVRVSTAPGEKSTFSITPFLNKTTSILVDSPGSDDAAEAQDTVERSPVPLNRAEFDDGAMDMKIARATKEQAAGSEKDKPRVLQEITAPRANAKIAPPRRTLGKLSLPKVAEEGDEENESTVETARSSLQSQPAKKKQKVLGDKGKSTLFDDDEAEQPKPRGRTLLGAGSKGPGLRGGPLSLASKPKSLAEFSPLKKDRKVT